MKIVVYRPHHRSLWNCRKRLSALGLHYEAESHDYAGDIDTDTDEGAMLLRKIERYCRWHGIVVEYGTFGERSADYRRQFFQENPPAFGGKWYFCSYCGMPVTRKELQVDHLYPVAQVKKSKALQKKLKKMGAESVNDPINLVPACRRCNLKKSSHMGLWIPLGTIGRHQKLWFFRWAVRLAMIAAVLILCLKYR